MTPRQPLPAHRSDLALRAAALRFQPPEPCSCCISTARVSDAVFCGGHSYVIDRDFLKKAITIMPGFRQLYLDERAFRDRAVEVSVQRGIRQFLDIGSGYPFAGALHRRLADVSGCRVVYADLDAMVTAHLAVETDPLDTVGSVRGDLLVPGTILFAEQTEQLLDFHEPICLVLTGILDSIDNDDALAEALRCYTDRMAPGSLLVASHSSLDGLDPADPAHRRLARQMSAICVSYHDTHVPERMLRDAETVQEFLGDLAVLDPGVVSARDWPAPAQTPAETPSLCLAAVAEVTR